MLHSSVTTLKTTLTSADTSKLLAGLSFKSIGTNSFSSDAKVWIGKDGQYINEFFNDSGEDLILVMWDKTAAWVNANVPYITHSLPAGSGISISMASGLSGGYSAIYSDTKLVNGQIANTWGEWSTAGTSSTFDVSRLVTMSGHDMKIETPSCVANMNQCAFTCDAGSDSCWQTYNLLDCPSNTGKDPYTGAPSGGCQGLSADGGLVRTTFY